MIKNRELVDSICFPVHAEPIFARTETDLAVSIPNIENFKAIVRDEDRAVLGVTTTKYGILPNALVRDRVFETIDELGMDAEVVSVESSKNGARHRIKIDFPDLKCDPGDGHLINYRMSIQNGYDGSYNLGFQHGAFRLVCTNGMIIGVRVQEFRRKHSMEIEEIFEGIVEDFRKILPDAPKIIADGTSKLVQTPVPYKPEDLGLVIGKLASLPDKYKQDLPGKNYWDAYNLLTDAISHDHRKRSEFRVDQLLGNVHEAFNNVMHMKATDFEEKLAEIRLAA